jgi:hypothetical protein
MLERLLAEERLALLVCSSTPRKRQSRRFQGNGTLYIYCLGLV